jgi:hypothetical protein
MASVRSVRLLRRRIVGRLVRRCLSAIIQSVTSIVIFRACSRVRCFWGSRMMSYSTCSTKLWGHSESRTLIS